MQYVEDSVGFQRNNDVLLEAKECYDGLDVARAKRRRNRRYTFPGDIGQWSDPFEGDTSKTEAQHIAEQGKTPLQFNQIYPHRCYNPWTVPKQPNGIRLCGS